MSKILSRCSTMQWPGKTCRMFKFHVLLNPFSVHLNEIVQNQWNLVTKFIQEVSYVVKQIQYLPHLKFQWAHKIEISWCKIWILTICPWHVNLLCMGFSSRQSIQSLKSLAITINNDDYAYHMQLTKLSLYGLLYKSMDYWDVMIAIIMTMQEIPLILKL